MSDCSANTAQIFPEPDPKEKYRFFNQPIEQIPSYDPDKPQILAHRQGCGLQWVTIDQCLDVVTCIKLESSELTIERRKIVILKDFDASSGCDNIPVTDCPNPTP